jgi:hypothetical protein
MASLAYTEQLYLAKWLPDSAQQRLVIWGYIGDQISKARSLGAEVSTTRALHQADAQATRALGSPWQLSTGWHSHKGYLQTWHETGDRSGPRSSAPTLGARV